MNRSNYQYPLLLALFLLLTACSPEQERAPDDRPLGVSAESFLREAPLSSLTVELLYVSGHEPEDAMLNSLVSFLQKHLYKPDGITIVKRAVAPPGGAPYSLSEIREFEQQNRTIFTAGSGLSAFIFIADGKNDTSDSTEVVLGKAYKNTSMVIFEEEIRDLSRRSGRSINYLLQTTIRHEFGHLFGLVNNGTPAQSPHEDGENGHCEVSDCLMNASLAFSFPDPHSETQILQFCAKCHQDLIANGGK